MSHRAVILLFVMPGCEACADFKPRFERMVKLFQQHGQPLVYHTNGRIHGARSIPIVVIDATSEDPSVVGLADAHKVEGMPTTILLTHNAPPAQLLGSVDDNEIHVLLTSACLANR